MFGCGSYLAEDAGKVDECTRLAPTLSDSVHDSVGSVAHADTGDGVTGLGDQAYASSPMELQRELCKFI